MHQETELKFAGDAEALGALRQSAAFEALTGRRPAQTVERRAVYFDTADACLRQAGYVLRVRNEGNVCCQTLKQIDDAGLFTRGEFESDIAGSEPDPRAIPDSKARWKIIHLLNGQKLVPVFEVETRRTRVLLSSGRNVEIEAAFDSGCIRLPLQPDRATSISEVEFELNRGGVDDLFSVARTLTQGLPLTLSFLSKAERGFRLARGEGVQASRATPLRLRRAASADDAIAAMIGCCLRHLLDNVEPVLAGDDVEGVHQMRVALRRMRVAFSMLSPEQRVSIEGTLALARRLSTQLGACRDQDVLLADLVLPVARRLGREGEFQPLVGRIEATRDRCREAVRALVTSQDFRGFALDVAAVTSQRPWLATASLHGAMEADVARFAVQQANRRLMQCRKAVRGSKRLKERGLHELRIRLKKLRYTLEFFGHALERRKTKALLKRLEKLQGLLGDMNDILAARQHVRGLLAENRSSSDLPTLALAGGMLIGWHGRRHAAIRRRARRKLKALAAHGLLRGYA